MTAQTSVDVVGSLLTSWKLVPRDVATSLNVIEFNRLNYSPKVALQPVVFPVLTAIRPQGTTALWPIQPGNL